MPDSIKLDRPCPIDYVDALHRIGGDTSFLMELLNIYFQEYAEKKRLLEEAIAREDFTQVRELGHSLKGSSANLSLGPLQKVAFSLEIAGQERKLQLVKDAVHCLETEIQSLRDFLRENPVG